MKMTFGQLLLELEGLRKTDAKMLEQSLTVHADGTEYPIELAVVLPDRRLKLIEVIDGE